ncbi:PIN domain-containing protein [Salinarimonas sp.]|uniref:PIN domain-containing protein n=1 Tax=Salinarimonas sp. TaxID=2766526 RepID=UPI00391C27D5
MSYVFDTGPLSGMFKHYNRKVFETLWNRFDQLIAGGEIVSCKEVHRELEDFGHADEWLRGNRAICHDPTVAEALFIREIFAVSHFQQSIDRKKLLNGGKIADPFVVAKARHEKRTVVTTEKYENNAAKIPNICTHFGVYCLSFDEFMIAQGWKF